MGTKHATEVNYSKGLESTLLEINHLDPVLSPGTQLKGSATNSRRHTMID